MLVTPEDVLAWSLVLKRTTRAASCGPPCVATPSRSWLSSSVTAANYLPAFAGQDYRHLQKYNGFSDFWKAYLWGFSKETQSLREQGNRRDSADGALVQYLSSAFGPFFRNPCLFPSRTPIIILSPSGSLLSTIWPSYHLGLNHTIHLYVLLHTF